MKRLLIQLEKTKSMKRLFIICMLAITVASCNEEGNSTERKLDSLELELDTLEHKIDTTLEKAWDSTKVKAKEIKEKVENKWKSRRDSITTDTIHN